jgi:hypothetical protein
MQTKLEIVSILHHGDDGVTLVFDNDTTVRVGQDSVEMLELAFPGECESCGFDPNAPFDYDNRDDFEEDF